MTTDPFTEAAREEAERRWSRDQADGRPLPGYARMSRRIGFEIGALWARTRLAAQEPDEAARRVTYIEVEAYLAAFSEDLPPDTKWTPDTIARVRRGLAAAYAARRDEEAR